jgi:hypothetical protein
MQAQQKPDSAKSLTLSHQFKTRVVLDIGGRTSCQRIKN